MGSSRVRAIDMREQTWRSAACMQWSQSSMVWLNYSVFTGKFVLCLRFYMEILLKSAVVININGIIVKLAKTEEKLMRIVWFVFPSSQSWVFWRKLINNTHQCVIIVSIAKTHLSALHRELTRWVLQKKLSLMSKLYSFGVSL